MNFKLSMMFLAINILLIGCQPKPDQSVPLSSYTDINGEFKYWANDSPVRYIRLSKFPTKFSDEEKLNRFSLAYYSEKDEFKKREIAKTEIPRINSLWNKYQEQNYYSVPISDSPKKLIRHSGVTVGPYDFGTKSFPLANAPHCWDGQQKDLKKELGIDLEITSSKVPCSLPVTDETQAKLIEAARTRGTLDLKGTLYVFIKLKESSFDILATPLHAQIELVDSDTETLLATFNL